MTKHIKKISLRHIPKTSRTLPMIAMLAALGVSSLTYTVTVTADTAATTRTTGIHMQKGKRGGGERHQHGPSTELLREKPVAAGVIQSVSGSIVTVRDRESKLYTVDVSNATILKGGRGQASTTIAVTDLKVGDMFGAKGTLTGTHVIATQAMTSPQHAFMKKLHTKGAVGK